MRCSRGLGAWLAGKPGTPGKIKLTFTGDLATQVLVKQLDKKLTALADDVAVVRKTVLFNKGYLKGHNEFLVDKIYPWPAMAGRRPSWVALRPGACTSSNSASPSAIARSRTTRSSQRTRTSGHYESGTAESAVGAPRSKRGSPSAIA